MSVYKHILLATDLRPDTEQVFARALALRQAFDARLSVLHTLAPTAISMSGEMAVGAVGLDELNQDAAKRLADLSQRHNIHEEDMHLLCGNAKNEIADLAARIEADLVVIGHHDRGFLGLLVGATAEKVLQRARCDVLTVRVHKE